MTHNTSVCLILDVAKFLGKIGESQDFVFTSKTIEESNFAQAIHFPKIRIK